MIDVLLFVELLDKIACKNIKVKSGPKTFLKREAFALFVYWMDSDK